MYMILCQSNLCLCKQQDFMTAMLFENLKFKVSDCQMRNVSLLRFMQLFHSAVKAAVRLISQMLTRIRLRTPLSASSQKVCIFASVCVCVCVCVVTQESQTELNKRRHYHPSQFLPIAGDDRQNADTALLSNWIWDIIYSCFNTSGKSCGNNPRSLAFVPSFCFSGPAGGWMDGWMERLNVIWFKSCFLCHMQTGEHQYLL